MGASLAAVEKVTILDALVTGRYSVRLASEALGLSRTTVYAKLRRWGLTSPMFSNRAGRSVLRKEYHERCQAIRRALDEARDQVRGGNPSEQEQQGTSEVLRPEPGIDGGTQQR